MRVVPRGLTRAPTRSAPGRVLAGRGGPAAPRGVPGQAASQHPLEQGEARSSAGGSPATATRGRGPLRHFLLGRRGRERALPYRWLAPFLRASGIQPDSASPWKASSQILLFYRELGLFVTCSFIGSSQLFVLLSCYNLSKELVIHCFRGQPPCFLESFLQSLCPKSFDTAFKKPGKALQRRLPLAFTVVFAAMGQKTWESGSWGNGFTKH